MGEFIGLEALFRDENFQSGIKKYGDSVGKAESLTDHATGVLSQLGAVAGGALVVGFGAATAAAGALIGIAKVGIDALSDWNSGVNTLSGTLGTTGAQSSAWAVAFEHVGLSVEEGGAGLNFFVKNLNDLKNVQGGATTTTAKNADAIAGLNQRLDDANVRLQRAQRNLADAKVPTNGMRDAVEDAQKAVNRLNLELKDASALVPTAAAKLTPFQQALKDLGVRAFDAQGRLRTFDDLMPDLLDGFQKMPAGVKKSALAMDLFGARAGTKFLDFLSQGSEGLEKARRLAELYGLTIDTDLSDSVAELGFQFNDFNLAAKGAWVTVGKQVLPVVLKFANVVNSKLIPPLMDLVKRVAPLIGTALDKAFFIFDDFIGLISGDNKLPQLAKNVGDLFSAFGLNTQVTDFILGVGKFVKDAIPAVQSFLNILDLLRTGDFKGGIFGLQEDSPLINFLLTARDTVVDLWDALQTGDWNKAWFTITDGLGNLGGIAAEELQKAWNTSIKPTLVDWGTKFWDWVTDTAVPLAQTKLTDLRDEVVTWIYKNGPIAWSQLVQWGSDFWFWLADPNTGAVGKAAGAFNDFIELVKPELEKVGPAAWGLATTWGKEIWDWLTVDGGALDQLGPKLIELTQGFVDWTTSDAAKAQFKLIGDGFVWALVDGIKFEDDGSSTNPAISRFIKSLEVSIKNLQEGISNIGGEIGGSIADGLIKKMTGKETTDQTRQAIVNWLTAIVKGITFGDFSGIPPLIIPPPANLNGVPIPPGATNGGLTPVGGGSGNLSGLGSMVPVTNAFSGQTLAAQQSLQTVPMNLQIQIGDQEIQNVVATYSYGAILDAMTQAKAQVQQNLPH